MPSQRTVQTSRHRLMAKPLMLRGCKTLGLRWHADRHAFLLRVRQRAAHGQKRLLPAD